MEVLLSDICEYIRNTKNYISLSDFIADEFEGVLPPTGSLIDYYTEIDGHRDNRTLIISGYGFDSKGNTLLRGHNRNWKLISRNGQRSKETHVVGIKIPLNKVLKHIFSPTEEYLAWEIGRMEKGQITIPSNAKFAAYTSKGLVIYGDFSIEYCKNMLKEYNIKSSLIYWEEEVKDMSNENKLTLKIGSDGNIQNCVIGTIPEGSGYEWKPFTDCPKKSPKFTVGQTVFFNAGPRSLSHYVDSELLKNLSSKVKESIMKAIIKTYGIEKCIITQVKLEGNHNTPMEYVYEVNLPAKYNEISVHANTTKKEKELFPEKDLEIIDYILKGIKDKELVTKEIVSRAKDFFETVLN